MSLKPQGHACKVLSTVIMAPSLASPTHRAVTGLGVYEQHQLAGPEYKPHQTGDFPVFT